MACQTCDTTAVPDSDPYNHCQTLHTGESWDSTTNVFSCAAGYTLISGHCYTAQEITVLSNFPVSTAHAVVYTDNTATAQAEVDNANSALINSYWEKAVVKCGKHLDQESCQIVANLCA
jgi:hypothetical protein